MRPQDLREYRDRHPFVPFRLVFTDGRAVDIPHQDFLGIGKNLIEVGVVSDTATVLGTETIVASLLHVIRIEFNQPLA